MLNPLPTQSYETQITQLPKPLFSTDNVAHNSSTVAYTEGQTIIHMMGLGKHAYVVTSGEAAVYVNGRPVDLIEAGEYFDESIWLGGEVIALTDCTLRLVNDVQPEYIRH